MQRMALFNTTSLNQVPHSIHLTLPRPLIYTAKMEIPLKMIVIFMEVVVKTIMVTIEIASMWFMAIIL